MKKMFNDLKWLLLALVLTCAALWLIAPATSQEVPAAQILVQVAGPYFLDGRKIFIIQDSVSGCKFYLVSNSTGSASQMLPIRVNDPAC